MAAAGCDQAEHGFLATAAGLAALAESGVAFDPQCRMLMDGYLNHRSRWEGLPGFGEAEYAMMTRLRDALPGILRAALATPGLRQVYGSDAGAGMHGDNGEDLICRASRRWRRW